MPLIIGTRGSDLALWQARHIQQLLGGEAAGVTLEIIRTTGDKILDIPLQGQLDKGFFTKELETALLERRIDVAVHSLKDLPTQMPAGLVLAAVPQRADVNDLLLIHRDSVDATQPLNLRHGARVGTSSLRRIALLKHAAPQAHAAFLRGNVPTRLNKVDTGELNAVILARAGVSRLRLRAPNVLAFDLNPRLWLPAAAQGALGIQARLGDPDVVAQLNKLQDAATLQAVDLERGLLRRIEGGCHSAFGALAEMLEAPAQATLRAGLSAPDGTWHSLVVTGRPADLVENAYAAVQAILGGGTQAVEAADGAESWACPAAAWF